MNVLFEDNHLLVVNKRSGQLVQGDRSGEATILDEAKAYLKERYNKPGNVYVGLVHRLDRPASGVLVLARTSKAAGRLSEEIRERRPTKIYHALVSGKTPANGTWCDQIARKGYGAAVVQKPDGKEARLRFQRIGYRNGVSKVEIYLETGRHHQIRVQFSSRGFPILGDSRYGSHEEFGDGGLALHAREMRIAHPVRREEEMVFVAEVSSDWDGW